MEVLELEDKHFLGKGGQRECYLHPYDETKVLKIMYRCNSSKENVNKLEYLYIKSLKKRNASLSHISICSNFLKTNKGNALVFDRVLNYDSTPSISFREAILNNNISYTLQEKLLDELFTYLKNEKILFIDYELSNLFLKEVKKNRYKLVIIDGLGAKRLDFKFWFYSYILFYTKIKIVNQWEKFIEEYYFERELLSNLKQGSKRKIDYTKLIFFKKTRSKELFYYPSNKEKIIKINTSKATDKNFYEYKYYAYLIKNAADLNFLPKCYGIQFLKDRRKSIVFDLVLDFNTEVSKSITSMIDSKRISEEKISSYFFELLNILEKNEIYTKNLTLEKILCQEIKPSEYKLKIVSGLGDKKSNLQFILFNNIKFYRKYFLKKEIKRLKSTFKSYFN